MYCKFSIAALLLICFCTDGTIGREIGSIESAIAAAKAVKAYGQSFYDVATNVSLKGELKKIYGLRKNIPQLLKIQFKSRDNEDCKCEDSKCKCCVGFNLTTIDFERHFCADFAYNTTAYAIDVGFSVNDHEIYRNSLSVNNPPPACMPLPYLPIVQLCLKFYDVKVSRENQTMHTCTNLEVRIFKNVLLVHSFDCVNVGGDGFVAWHAPAANATVPAAAAAAEIGNNNQTVIAAAPAAADPPISALNSQIATVAAAPTTEAPTTEFHDFVEFESFTAAAAADKNVDSDSNATLSPEQADKIGSHRVT